MVEFNYLKIIIFYLNQLYGQDNKRINIAAIIIKEIMEPTMKKYLNKELEFQETNTINNRIFKNTETEAIICLILKFLEELLISKKLLRLKNIAIAINSNIEINISSFLWLFVFILICC